MDVIPVRVRTWLYRVLSLVPFHAVVLKIPD